MWPDSDTTEKKCAILGHAGLIGKVHLLAMVEEDIFAEN